MALSRIDVPDALFASDNPCDVPTLLLDHQADFVCTPVLAWGAVKRNQKMTGSWHFYVDDYRFRALWDDPTPVVNSDCRCVVEPNFTTSEQMPFPVALWATYRKRWLARYWQSFGIKIHVDLNVAPEYAAMNLLGVPSGWRAYMTRGYADRLDATCVEYEIACEHRRSRDIEFAVYGGGQAVRELCRQRGWIHIPETMDCRKGKYISG